MIFSIVKNNYNIAKSQDKNDLHTLRNFKAVENSENIVKSSSKEDKLSDVDLFFISSYEPDKKFTKVADNALKTLLVTIPILDTVLSGAIKSGNLSSKLFKSLSTAGKWGAVFTAGTAVAATKSIINSKVEKLDNFDKKHPLLSTFADFFAIYCTFDFLLRAGNKTLSYVDKKFPKFLSHLDKFIAQPLKSGLNKSYINNKMVIPADKFMMKRPYLASSTKLLASLIVPAMTMASIIRFDKELKNRNAQIEKNISLLRSINDNSD